jgi:hypothetical protein
MSFDLVKIQFELRAKADFGTSAYPQEWILGRLQNLFRTSLSIHHLFLGGGYFSNIFEIFL